MIELKNVRKSFGKKEAQVEALRGVTLTVREGEMAAVMGKSGSGKSTLLNILGGMMSMDSGTYSYQGQPVDFRSQKELARFRRDEVGFVVQYFALAEDLNIFQNVALPLKYQGRPRKEIREMVTRTLEGLGIADKAKAYPYELSGGQQQMVALFHRLSVQHPLAVQDADVDEGLCPVPEHVQRHTGSGAEMGQPGRSAYAGHVSLGGRCDRRAVDGCGPASGGAGAARSALRGAADRSALAADRLSPSGRIHGCVRRSALPAG